MGLNHLTSQKFIGQDIVIIISNIRPNQNNKQNPDF